MLAALPLWAQTDSQWMLEQSTLTYHMSHPMHEVNGVSRAAKGKGTCHAGRCDFLIAAPVRSFDSGIAIAICTWWRQHAAHNFHGGGAHPVSRDSDDGTDSLCGPGGPVCGQTAYYKQVPFQRTAHGNEVQISGTVPATCSDFKIERPSFLTVPIKNEIPVRVEMTWRRCECGRSHA